MNKPGNPELDFSSNGLEQTASVPVLNSSKFVVKRINRVPLKKVVTAVVESPKSGNLKTIPWLATFYQILSILIKPV